MKRGKARMKTTMNVDSTTVAAEHVGDAGPESGPRLPSWSATGGSD